jgi:hypothetical protein
MNDNQINPMEQFETTDACTISQARPKQHFFYVAWQDSTGKIVDIKHYEDYELALMKGMEKAKDMGTTYTIRDLNGRFVDGNFVGR